MNPAVTPAIVRTINHGAILMAQYRDRDCKKKIYTPNAIRARASASSICDEGQTSLPADSAREVVADVRVDDGIAPDARGCGVVCGDAPQLQLRQTE